MYIWVNKNFPSKVPTQDCNIVTYHIKLSCSWIERISSFVIKWDSWYMWSWYINIIFFTSVKGQMTYFAWKVFLCQCIQNDLRYEVMFGHINSRKEISKVTKTLHQTNFVKREWIFKSYVSFMIIIKIV